MKKVIIIFILGGVVQLLYSQYINDNSYLYFEFGVYTPISISDEVPSFLKPNVSIPDFPNENKQETFFLRINYKKYKYSILDSSWGGTFDHYADGTSGSSWGVMYGDTISIGTLKFSNDTIFCIDSKSNNKIMSLKRKDKYRIKVIYGGKYFVKNEVLYLRKIASANWIERFSWLDKKIFHRIVLDFRDKKKVKTININYKQGIPIDTVSQSIK